MKMYLPTPFFQILEKKGERSHQKVIIKEQLENSNIQGRNYYNGTLVS